MPLLISNRSEHIVSEEPAAVFSAQTRYYSRCVLSSIASPRRSARMLPSRSSVGNRNAPRPGPVFSVWSKKKQVVQPPHSNCRFDHPLSNGQNGVVLHAVNRDFSDVSSAVRSCFLRCAGRSCASASRSPLGLQSVLVGPCESTPRNTPTFALSTSG